MTRRCSHCGGNGHNSRTCPTERGGGGGVKLFGVRLDVGNTGMTRNCCSMGNLVQYERGGEEERGRDRDGYVSEDLGNVGGSATATASNRAERKKGVAWTEEEHRMFLLGLQKLGKGDWRGISRKFVVSRTATQVASHAQKYFIRQTNQSRRKRRTSLFDMVPDEGDSQALIVFNQEPEPLNSSNPVPASSSMEAEDEPINSEPHSPVPTTPVEVQPSVSDPPRSIPRPEAVQYPYAVVFPTPYPPFYPYAYPSWPYYTVDAKGNMTQSVYRPTGVHPAAPINVSEISNMSKLTLEVGGGIGASVPRLGGSDRPSAFVTASPHANEPRSNSSSSPIHAI